MFLGPATCSPSCPLGASEGLAGSPQRRGPPRQARGHVAAAPTVTKSGVPSAKTESAMSGLLYNLVPPGLSPPRPCHREFRRQYPQPCSPPRGWSQGIHDTLPILTPRTDRYRSKMPRLKQEPLNLIKNPGSHKAGATPGKRPPRHPSGSPSRLGGKSVSGFFVPVHLCWAPVCFKLQIQFA